MIFGLGGRFRSLGGLRYYFSQKITSEMDLAYKKTYILIPHIIENDNWFFCLRGHFRGLKGLMYYFFPKNNFKNGFSIPKNLYFNTSHHRKWQLIFLASEAVLEASKASYIIFSQKITSDIESAYPNTYVSIPHFIENDNWFFWPSRPF